MGTIKKSITVTDQHEAFIQAQLATGQYASESEVIRDALREKQARMAEIDALRARLEASKESGWSARSPEGIRQAVKKRLKADEPL